MDHLVLKSKVLEYYENLMIQDESLRQCINTLNSAEDWLQVVFPYEWVSEFISDQGVPELVPGGQYVDVHLKSCPEFKLRLPASNAEEIWYRQFYLQLVAAEQCIYSPHRYWAIPEDCSIIDVGGSEGIFGFFYGHPSNEFHIFDEGIWDHCAKVNLMRRGIQDVHFYSQYVESSNPPQLELTKPLGCIKIDVDGPEIDVLNALKSYVQTYHPLIQVAVYHYDSECQEVIEWLSEVGCPHILTSEGWMLYPRDNNQTPPYFRKGLVFGHW